MQLLIGSCRQPAVKRRDEKWSEGLSICGEGCLQMDEEVRVDSFSQMLVAALVLLIIPYFITFITYSCFLTILL